MLLELGDDPLAHILRKCRADLVAVAGSCKLLCRSSRLDVPFYSAVDDSSIQVFLQASHSSTPAFTGCSALDLRISIRDGDEGSTIAAALAADKWSGLEYINLQLQPSALDWVQADQYAGNALSSLSSLKQLRDLYVGAPLGPCSISNIGAATQLTLLELGKGSCGLHAPPTDLSALSTLTNLHLLACEVRGGPLPPAATASGASCFPGNLKELVLRLYSPEGAYWLCHLGGCPHLQELTVQYEHGNQHPSAAPAAVVALAAQSTPGLTSLAFNSTVLVDWDAHLPLLPAAEAEAAWHPNPALASLQRLQHLDIDHDLPLRIGTADEWRWFGSLGALRKVHGLEIDCAMPEGVQLQRLEWLESGVRLSGTDTRRLLAACPVLDSVSLYIVPQPEQPSVAPTPPAAGAGAAAAAAGGAHGALQSAEFTYADGTDACDAAAHFAAVLPALASVPRLSLDWTESSTTSPHLPDLGGLTALTSLCLRGQGGVMCVQDEDLLLALQPVSGTLKELAIKSMPLVSPRVVLVLQHTMPALQSVVFDMCARLTPLTMEGQCRRNDEQLVLLRGLLRPGMTLKVDWG